jgi:hypothetical protein
MTMPEGLRSRELVDHAGPAASPDRDDDRATAIAPESTASYIADIATQLAGLARGSELDILAYLLDIAQLEAKHSVRRLRRETYAR